MTPNPSRPATCPSCSARVDGRFCAQCGAPVDGATCGACRAPLTPGAKFCHRCGTAAGAGPATAAAPAASSALPWAFAAIALLAFGAYVAAQHFGGTRAAPAVAAGTGGVPTDPMANGPFAGAPSSVGAPDISQMSPEERADRLFNRIMTEYEAGNSEFVQNMAPMAFAAYQMLPQMDPLRRYDLGRIAEITGALPVAQAQADTLLQTNPNHLLGLALAARVADLQHDEARRAALARRLIEAAPAELEQRRPEYEAHSVDINIALTEARRRAR
ncbi:MAG TPA: zinc ribbon domain-containing protein [Gemmatimonadaceae bacterium]|nr:zinc ribbon domain-containing protein [Gemmatimonadaceae bacterium]